MPAALRFTLFVIAIAALGMALGAGIEILSGQSGWWIVGLLAGAIVGALLGYLRT